MRKHLVEYDDVVNTQRQLIYDERRKILSGADLKANILSLVKEELENMVAAHIDDERDDERNLEGLLADASAIFPLPPELNADTLSPMKPKQIKDRLTEYAEALYEQREAEMGAKDMRVLERLIMLRTIDNLWREHLTAMESMRREAGWQSLRQIRPVDAYKKEGYKQFQLLLSTIQHDVVHTVYHVGIVRKEARKKAPVMAQAETGGSRKKKLRAGGKKIGRNDPCPCGSGKKYKHCCGK